MNTKLNISVTSLTEDPDEMDFLRGIEETTDYDCIDTIESIDTIAEETLTEEDLSEIFGDSDDGVIPDGFKALLDNVSKCPLLSLEEELALGKSIKEQDENAAQSRETLILSNIRLVVHVAKQYLRSGISLDELSSMGYEGLIRAVDRFDYEKGNHFSTYAIWWIRQSIARSLSNEASPIHIPVHMGEDVRKIRKAQKEFYQANGREATIAELASCSDYSASEIKDIFDAMFEFVSFDKKVGEDGDSTLEDFIRDENATDPCAALLSAGLEATLRQVLDLLPPKEALVLKLRYGIDRPGPATLEEIAHNPLFGVSRERIRQIEMHALRTIRTNPKAKALLMDYSA